MTFKEAAQQLRTEFDHAKPAYIDALEQLEKRVEQLEKILINALNRLDYLEKNQCH